MVDVDGLIGQLFDTSSELMEELQATDFEMTETDVLSDLTLQISIKIINEEDN